MTQPTANPIPEINKSRILKIKWPDETCIFINEAYSNGVLTIKYKFVDTTGPGEEPCKNSYSLDAFDTEIGVVKKVVFVSSLTDIKFS